ncbi:MAG: hypothetical protein RR458_01430 [Clostridia bacterium]
MEIKQIENEMIRYYDDAYQDEKITITVLKECDNRTHYRVVSGVFDHELCVYDAENIFIRTFGLKGAWFTLDDERAEGDDAPRKIIEETACDTDLNFEYVGRWWNSDEIQLIKFNEGHIHAGRVFALHGWNGEEYVKCWECFGKNHRDASKEEFILRPIYRYELKKNAAIDLDYLEEHDYNERNRQCEFVDFKIEY